MGEHFSHIGFDDRLRIQDYILKKLNISQIAEMFERPRWTIQKELNRGVDLRGVYNPYYSQLNNHCMDDLPSDLQRMIIEVITEYGRAKTEEILRGGIEPEQ